MLFYLYRHEVKKRYNQSNEITFQMMLILLSNRQCYKIVLIHAYSNETNRSIKDSREIRNTIVSCVILISVITSGEILLMYSILLYSNILFYPTKRKRTIILKNISFFFLVLYLLFQLKSVFWTAKEKLYYFKRKR